MQKKIVYFLFYKNCSNYRRGGPPDTEKFHSREYPERRDRFQDNEFASERYLLSFTNIILLNSPVDALHAKHLKISKLVIILLYQKLNFVLFETCYSDRHNGLHV